MESAVTVGGLGGATEVQVGSAREVLATGVAVVTVVTEDEA